MSHRGRSVWPSAGRGRSLWPGIGTGGDTASAASNTRASSVGICLVGRVRDRAARLVGLAGQALLPRSAPGSAPSRSAVSRAAETVALVLDEEAPVPETSQDVADLLHRLNGHCMELGAVLPSGPWAQRLEEARQLAEQAPSANDFLAARVHLRKLAEQLAGVLGEMAVPRPAPGRDALEDRLGGTPAQFGAAAFWRQS